MNRRTLILGLMKSAGLLMTAQALSSCASARSPVTLAVKPWPYGADTLENTDPAKLSESLKNQLRDAGLPTPAIFEPFPGKDWELEPALTPNEITGLRNLFGPFFPVIIEVFFNMVWTKKDEYSTPTKIVGTSAYNRDLEKSRAFFNNRFRNQPACDALLLSKAAWRVCTALHETTHYVTFNVNKNGQPLKRGETNLADHVYSRVNKASPPQESNAYTASLRASLEKNPGNTNLANRLVVARALRDQIDERLADAGTALYALSNYTDTRRITDYFEKLADLRKALFTNDQHHTTTTIRAALSAFPKNPRKGLSIAETAVWAATVILTQPEFQRSLAEMARETGNIIHVQTRLEKGDAPNGFHPSDKKQRDEMYHGIIESRNRVCSATMPVP